MSNIPDIQILDWDSGFFGFTIGKLLPASHLLIDGPMIEKWRNLGIRCLYIDAAPDIKVTNNTDAILVDVGSRCLMRRDTQPSSLDPDVIPVKRMTNALLQLGILSGEHSRFIRDTHFPQERSKALYTTWISESLHGKMGDEIFIIGDEEHPEGFITCTNKKEYLHIGLMAILSTSRNKGLSKKLLTAADHFAQQHELPYMILYTQHDNERAQHVFGINGFMCMSKMQQYHLWI